MRKCKILLVFIALATLLVTCDDEDGDLSTFSITRVVRRGMPVDVVANANGDCVDFTFLLNLEQDVMVTVQPYSLDRSSTYLKYTS